MSQHSNYELFQRYSGNPILTVEDWPYKANSVFNAGAEPSPAHNGINPGEWLTITFNLKSGKIFSDVVSNLQTNALRIGVHVISLPDGSSEAAVTPEPATICLLGVSSLALLLRKRRF